jgi:hypothetical protein
MRAFVMAFAMTLAGCEKVCVPADRTAIFPAEQAPDLLRVSVRPPEKVSGYWTPSLADLRRVEETLEVFHLRASKRTSGSVAPGGWRHYYRQVTGIIHDGRKSLFLSYAWLPEERDPAQEAMRRKDAEAAGRSYLPDSWKHRAIVVSDGGWMYFRVIYDLSGQQFVWYDDNLR